MKKDEIVKKIAKIEKEKGLPEALNAVFGENVKVTLGFSKSSCNASIEELNLSVRSYNGLRRAEVAEVGDLIEMISEDRLKKIRNLGNKSVSEIKTKLLVYGFEKLSEREKSEFFECLAEKNIVA